MSDTYPVSVAQITDIHLFADENQELLGIPTKDSFCAVIEHLGNLDTEIDMLLLTGDISGDGSPESYENLQNLLYPLRLPTYSVPGNHDCSNVMKEVLNLKLFSRRKSFERGGWNFILLNSCISEQAHGYLSIETLDWLDAQLTILDSKPTLIALHHPPFLINSQWLDKSRLQNPEDLFAIIDRHSYIKLVICGHIHQEFQYQRYQVNYLSTPSTCIQFQPNSPDFTLDDKQPGFRYLKLYSNGDWESWVERVPFLYPLNLSNTGH
ncbi:3',5'-cyclic-nucleotide phosphodiesterase [Richelia intracellularis HM01]|uniref:3',5'-cyclic-AMP phosphodiesterase n=1 Tax=Richelia intracellularis TaxID=1164990 RepID=UPI0002B4EB4B|nr:3',5'-cyclic-AMP phosphodiesterase [Richelia intracellularis]CCH65799.1 3',5'-cyclic-nucleotide phosphodiesterase [Richelia intracellularis HM01]